MSRYDLEGKGGIVTGGAKGMGRAIALRLGREGVAVLVADLNLDGAVEVAEEIESHGGRASALKADVTQRDDARKMVSETVARYGRLDILVNNAGVLTVTPVMEMTEPIWDHHMNVNAKAVLLCSQEAARQMIAQGEGGRIITIASVAGTIPSGEDTPIIGYVASKHAAVGLTKQMALELAQHGILVNCVFPGIVDTDMLTMLHGEMAKLQGRPAGLIREEVEATIPLRYIQPPEKVANMVAFLCSSDADYSTASVFGVTGGAFPYY